MHRVKWWLAATGLLATLLLTQAADGLASPSRATSTSHVFTVAVPSGFHNDTAKFSGGAIRFELVLAGSVSNGFAVNINVVRERSQGVSIGKLAQASKTDLTRLNKAHDFSTVQDLTIGGAPARAFSFSASFGGGKVLHDRQAYVIHDGWGYVVTFSALPSQYAGSVSALSDCMTSWHWL